MRTNATSFRYLDVLRLPHVPLTFGSATVGRAAYALVILPLLFAVQQGTGSVATAGLAVGLYGLAAALLAPVRASLIDNFGRRRILMSLSSAFGLALSMLAGASFINAPAPAMIALAALAGAVAPPLGPTMRVVWSELAREPAAFKKALSLDAVVEELLYLAGPAVAGLALTVVSPATALLVPAILVVLGTALFVSTTAIKAVPGTTAKKQGDRSWRVRRKSLLRDRRFVGVLLPALVAGLISGHYTVAIPAMFPGSHGGAVAGIALGLFAGGSALGGLVFGAVNLRLTPGAQLVMVTSGLVLFSSTTSIFANAVMICISITVAGLFFSPVMIVAYFAANEFGGGGRQTQATTWVNTSHNIGGAAGSAVAGFLIQQATLVASFVITGVACLTLLTFAAFALRSKRSPILDTGQVPARDHEG